MLLQEYCCVYHNLIITNNNNSHFRGWLVASNSSFLHLDHAPVSVHPPFSNHALSRVPLYYMYITPRHPRQAFLSLSHPPPHITCFSLPSYH